MNSTPTTKEVQQQLVEAARAMHWMVCAAGTDYTACVIAWSKGETTQNGLLTNWCRVAHIVDGKYEVETVRCDPSVMASGYVTDHLSDYKLN